MVFNLNAVRTFIVVLFIAIGQVHAATIINASRGYITSTEEWTKDRSPYILNADVQIARNGGFLTIHEGVEVQGNGRRIKVGDRLLISGTKQSKILNSKHTHLLHSLDQAWNI